MELMLKTMHKNCPSSQSCKFANVLHVFIVKVKYQITTSKAVVGVDQPVSAYLIINVENLHKKLSKFIS